MENPETGSAPNNAKGCLIGLAALVIVVAAFFHLVTTSEAIPDRAKFVYNSRLRVIIPCPQVGQAAFYPVPGKFDDMRRSLTSEWDGVTTWAVVKKKDGAFADYSLPKGEGWDDYVFYGRPIPLWKATLFRPKSRWDEEGYWRY